MRGWLETFCIDTIADALQGAEGALAKTVGQDAHGGRRRAGRGGWPMTARRRAKAAPESMMLMDSPEWPLRLVMLGREGLQARAQGAGGLDNEELQRAVAPLICLVSDMEDAMQREEAARRAVPKAATKRGRARASATVGTGGEEA